MIFEGQNTAAFGLYQGDPTQMQTDRDKANILQSNKQNIPTLNRQPSLLTNLKAEYKKTLARRSQNQPSRPNDLPVLTISNEMIDGTFMTQASGQPQAQAKLCENKRNLSPCLYPNYPKSDSNACPHKQIVRYRCKYCKDCGAFLPKGNSETLREARCKQKLGLNPDRVLSLMLKSQKKNRYYDPNAKHLKERKALVKWICELGRFMKYSSDTVHVAVSYLDSVLLQLEIPQNKYQLVALVCTYLAGKFNETDSKSLRMKDIYDFTKGVYPLELLEKTELLVLELLQWNIRTVTPPQFLELFLERGIAFSTDNSAKINIGESLLRYMRKAAKFIINATLSIYSFNRFDSHIVACAGIAVVRKFAGLTQVWNEQLTELTTATWEQIEVCFKELMQVCQTSCPQIARKFFQSVSSCKIQPGASNCFKMEDMLIEEERIQRFNSQKMLIEEESEVIDKSAENLQFQLNFYDNGQNSAHQGAHFGHDMLIETLSQKELAYSNNNFNISEKCCQNPPFSNLGFSMRDYFQMSRTPEDVENFYDGKILSQMSIEEALASPF